LRRGVSPSTIVAVVCHKNLNIKFSSTVRKEVEKVLEGI